MSEMSQAKSNRLLKIYHRLQGGRVLNKASLADEFGVTPRSIQRDMESLRCFLMEQEVGIDQDIIYDRRAGGYRLVSVSESGLSNGEILTVCKILLESRSLRQDEMMPILEKLIDCCVPEDNRGAVSRLVSNERLHYIPPHHDSELVDKIWALGQAVQRNRVLEIEYQKLLKKKVVKRILEPVGLMFSEYYFYLVAFIRDIDRSRAFQNPDDLFPTIYRVDRILDFKETGETFRPAYAKRFQEGEFRKRVQFMYGGRLQTVQFTCTDHALEAVLDRLPTAQIIEEKDGVYTVRAEEFGKGIEMWMKSQGDNLQTEWRGVTDSKY